MSVVDNILDKEKVDGFTLRIPTIASELVSVSLMSSPMGLMYIDYTYEYSSKRIVNGRYVKSNKNKLPRKVKKEFVKLFGQDLYNSFRNK